MNCYGKVATSIGVMALHLIINNKNCCLVVFFVFSLILEVFVLTPSLTIFRGKRVFSLQISQFDWSILVDAADLEVILVVLKIPHDNCLLNMKMF